MSDPLTGDLPENIVNLVQTIRANDPSTGGENRRATAELQARLALVEVHHAKALTRATQVLALATIALVLATVVLIVVTATAD